MRTDVSFLSHGTRLAAWHWSGEGDALTSTGGRPCVVMAHGFGATKDAGLEPFAERFAAAGADVLMFDYRGFGTSEGFERQVVDHRRHREDYVAAVAHARTLEGVDPDRIVLWGSSYSGGHVVAVAGGDPRIAGVVSQGAAMDGLGAVLQIVSYAGLLHLLKLSAHALRDAVGHLLRRPPRLMPIVGPPGSVAAITSADGESGYRTIMGPTFRNEMPGRCVLPIMTNRPVTHAKRLHMPLMLVLASQDSIAPPSAVERVGRLARGPVTIERLDVGHFDIYVGEPFETSVAAQVEFLRTL